VKVLIYVLGFPQIVVVVASNVCTCVCVCMCAIEVVVCCVEVVMIAQFQKQNFFYDDIQQKKIIHDEEGEPKEKYIRIFNSKKMGGNAGDEYI
jgi:hypothetical protein